MPEGVGGFLQALHALHGRSKLLDHKSHEKQEELRSSSPTQWKFTFKSFMFFMVKSRCVSAGCSNSGMLLTLQVSLSPVNKAVKLDMLEFTPRYR